MDARLRMYLAELFCTFLLVFVAAGTVCSTFVPGDGRFATVGGVTLGVALAEGIAVAVAVTTASYLSLGCCNPAITLTLFVARRFDLGQASLLIAMQLLGSFLAGMAVRGLYADSILIDARMGAPHLKAFLGPSGQITFTALVSGVGLEAIFTIFLVLAAFATLLDPRAPRMGAVGLGMAQTAVVLFGYHLTGGSGNPARWFGPALWQLSLSMLATPPPLGDHMVYWLGPFLGALVGGLFYVLIIQPPATTTSAEIRRG